MLRSILFGGESGLSFAANAGLALVRIFAGVSIALAHGIHKIPPGEGLITGTANLGFPMPTLFAWAAGLSEFFGGIFLALGFLTRFAGFFVAFTMLVAILGVHGADPYSKKELALAYFFIATAFMIKGSGDWSLDGALRR
ncbi:MAG: DoxX family protein [Pyrinomonadaceae bacterium]